MMKKKLSYTILFLLFLGVVCVTVVVLRNFLFEPRVEPLKLFDYDEVSCDSRAYVQGFFFKYLSKMYYYPERENIPMSHFCFYMLRHIDCELVRVSGNADLDENSDEFLFIARLFAGAYSETEIYLREKKSKGDVLKLAGRCLKTLNKVKRVDLKKYRVCEDLCSDSIKKEMERYGFEKEPDVLNK